MEVKERRQLEKLALFSYRVGLLLSKAEADTRRRRRGNSQLLPADRLIRAFFEEAESAVDLLQRLDYFGEKDSKTLSDVREFIEEEMVFGTVPDRRFRRKLDYAAPYFASSDSPLSGRFRELIEKTIKPFILPLEDKIKKKYSLVRAIISGDMAKSSEIKDEALRTRAKDDALGVLFHNGGQNFEAGDDEFFSAFVDVNKGVAAGVLLLRETKKYKFINTKGENKFVTYRLGMHRGLILTGKEKPPRYEENLAMAKRARSLTDGDDGRFYLTAEAYEKLNLSKVRKLVGGSIAIHMHVGPFEVKGDYPMEAVYEVLWQDGQLPLPPNTKK